MPKEQIDQQNELVVKAYHRDKDAKLFWFLDDQFVRATVSTPHDILLKVGKGMHTLTITDQKGNRDQVLFEILGRE